MGPWYSPYADGPDPKLVRSKRLRIQFRNIKEAMIGARSAFTSVGRAAFKAAYLFDNTLGYREETTNGGER